MAQMDKVRKAWNDIVDNGVSVEYFNEQADKDEEDSTITIIQELINKVTVEEGK